MKRSTDARPGDLFPLIERFPSGVIALTAAMLMLSATVPRPLLAEEKQPLVCAKKLANEAANKKRAGRLFEKGERAFKGKKYKMAIERFLCSLSILEHEATITNIERVIQEMGNKEPALELVEAYLTMNPVGELNSRMEEIHKSLQVELGIIKEEKTEEVVCPACPPPPPQVPCPPLPDIRPFEAAHASSQKNLKIFGWITAGVGAASLVAGVVLQVLAVAGNQPATATNKFQVGAIAGFSAGAIAGGIGTAELVIWHKRKKMFSTADAPKAEPEVTPTPETPAPATAPEPTAAPAAETAPATEPPATTTTTPPTPEEKPATETAPATAPATPAPEEKPATEKKIETKTSASLSIRPGVAGLMMTLRF